MSEVGYPTTTNRAGSWYGNRSEHPHLRDVLRPLRERGIQSVGMVGLDDESERLQELASWDPRQFQRLAGAIQTAVDASRMTHPHIIATDPRDHQISQAETKRRMDWCLDIAMEVRRDLKWSLARICDELPSLLGRFLDGDFLKAIKEARHFWKRKKVPRGLPAETPTHQLTQDTGAQPSPDSLLTV